MKKLSIFLGITFIINSILTPSVLAGTTNISPGDIQIEVGGISLDFEGGISILDQLSLSYSGNSMDITVSGSAYAKFVSNNPGLMQLTLIPSFTHALANAFVRAITPAFVAEYRGTSESPLIPEIEAMLITCEPSTSNFLS